MSDPTAHVPITQIRAGPARRAERLTVVLAARVAPKPAKTAGDENFPVASLLIAPDLRPVVMAYYRAARAADDIADDRDLTADEKIRRLDAFEAAISEGEGADEAAAVEAARALRSRSIPLEHLTRLLTAFRRDAVQPRTADWADLMAYCADSANPVGRFLLDLHGESQALHNGSDALCTALQVLNHLQDCGDDYRALDRIYLPADWLATEGVTEDDLGAKASSPALRRVLDRCLGEVEVLLEIASPLPMRLRSARLALETAVVVALATALSRQLRALDPLGVRVQVSKPAMLGHAILAVSRCLLLRALPLGQRRHSG